MAPALEPELTELDGHISLTGKTTLTYRMTLGQVVATAPTIGSQVETFEYK